jgi:Cyclic nucleotide-binding domain
LAATRPSRLVYFPLDAVVSIVSTLADGSTLEVATIGNEGVVGLPCFLQGGRMPFTAFVQVPGAALKMEAEVFTQAVAPDAGSDRITGEMNPTTWMGVYSGYVFMSDPT